jgi:hypothetical protein
MNIFMFNDNAIEMTSPSLYKYHYIHLKKYFNGVKKIILQGGYDS